MPLTTRQRNALPRSAFGHAPKGTPRSSWKYPMPTKRQAQRAGISEASRQRTLNAAKSYSARRTTASSFARIAPVANRRAGATTARRSAGIRSGGATRMRGRGR